MYKSIRILRIIIALIALAVPTWAMIAGYESVFARMQIFVCITSGAGVILLFWVLVTFIYGRIYCSTLCPLGTMMDCVGATSRIVRKQSKHFRYTPPATRMRWTFLALTIILMLSSSALLSTLMDPYSAYARIIEEFIARPLGRSFQSVQFGLSTLIVAIITAAGVVWAAWKHGRIICNTVCPVGTLLGACAQKSVFHIEIDPDRCTGCGECERVCKAQCIKLTERLVDNSRCVTCFDCTAVCPHDAINYKAGRHRLGIPMLQSTNPPATMASLDGGPQQMSENETVPPTA